MAVVWAGDARSAWAQSSCPSASGLTSTVASSIERIELSAYERMADLDGQSCSDFFTPTWCEESYGYVPYGTPRDKLFLWLVGRGNRPAETHFVPTTAAYVGYHTINLAYDNEREIGSWCDGSDECDTTCHFRTASELLFGVDDAATTYPGDAMHSVEGRLRLALEDLHDMDVNDDGTNDHGWDAFCAETDGSSPGPDVQWHRIETGGFSFGSQVTAYISYLEPGQEPLGEETTIGHFAVDGGAPTCGEVEGGTAPVTEDFFPVEMTQHAAYPPCGEASACPSTDRYLVMADGGLVDELFPWVDTALAEMSFDTTFYDVDADIAAGTIDLAAGNLLRTYQAPVSPGAFHESVAIDANMPSDLVGTSSFLDASLYFLKPLYVKILCEIDQ